MKGGNNTPLTLKVKKAKGQPRVVNPKFEEEHNAEPIQAKNEFQKKVLRAVRTKQIVVVKAPAGSGKTYLTMGTAADWLVKGDIEKITVTRPAVDMGKGLGFLKGGLDEKFDVYLAPLIEVFTMRYGRGKFDTALNAGNIEKVPLSFMRGRNIRGVGIVDEAQNMTKDEMFALITRVTEDGRLFIIGDPVQTDLKQESGLVWLFNFVEKHNLHEFIEIIEGTSDDIVRGGLCKSFVKAMEQENK